MTTKEEINVKDGVREELTKICRKLNIDQSTEERAWESFKEAWDRFDLTGEPAKWLCCALYLAFQQDLPVVGHPGHYTQGNGVDITNLLKQCKISIQDFFVKMKEWCELRSTPARFRRTLENLQHVFSVSIAAYNMFDHNFKKIFNEANIVPDEPKRNKKSKPRPCSYNKLREFSWLLFLNVKEQHKEQRCDLATAMDVCVCVLELIYRNVAAEGRLDLINPNVLGEGGCSSIDGGTPTAIETALGLNVREQVIIERTTDESVTETYRTIFLPSLIAMLDVGDLKGKQPSAGAAGNETDVSSLGLVAVPHFEDNLKLLNRRYERSILRCGMLDERIALSVQQRFSVEHPRTPLSAKGGARGGAGPHGLATGPAFVVRGTLRHLMSKIQGHERGKPRGTFLILMQNCTPSPLGIVVGLVQRVRQRFVQSLVEKENWNGPSAESRFDAIEALYYQLLENIIPWELKKRPSMTVSMVIYSLCSNEFFNETVIACAAEIIFFLRQEHHNFPWILDVFGMEPYKFYHIIEVTVAANSDIFTSEIVNHLRRIEEQLVDSICWKSSSVLWECMKRENYQIPANQDVEQRAEIAGVTPLKADSVPNTPNGTRGGGGTVSDPTPALAPTATSRPVPHPDSAKKKLFVDLPATPAKVQPASVATAAPTAGSSSSSSTSATSPAAVASTSSTVASTSAVASVPGTSTNGGFTEAPSTSAFSSPQRATDEHPPSNETRRLNFFFRKMYQVAYVRLCNLCQNLGLVTEVIQKLIWTIFEFTITKCSQDLMRDRHLDQLLMCAIFVTIRIKQLPKTFTQILCSYNSQPQANSAIYRSVFLHYETGAAPAAAAASAENGQQPRIAEGPENGANGEGTEQRRRPVSVTEMAGTSVQYDLEVYGDIIRFYNDIYAPRVHQFVMQYHNTTVPLESLILSPTPNSQQRNIQKSPRQISSGINLYVSSATKISSLKDSPNVRVLSFPGSPTPSKLRRLDKIQQDRQHQDHEPS